VSRRDDDIALLKRALVLIDTRREDRYVRARDPFEEMLVRLEEGRQTLLTGKQLKWVRDVLDEPTYENLVSAGKVPRGREVATPAVLLRRPLRPPGK
jgi:hypothetical protein